MSFQNLAPCLSQVETALKQCLSALSAEHPVSVSALSETIGHCANALKTCTTALLVSLLATCTSPSYAIAPHYQPTNNDSFILVDTVAMSGNNDRQEPRNLLNTVQHHTIVDVFLCLSFASLPFMGELRLAIALIALWWGGSGNKPFIRRIPLAVCLRFSSLPAALHLGKIKTKPNQTKPTPLICVKPFVNQPKTPVNEAQTETRGFYEKLNRRKSKGHDAQTSQPFSQFSPITEQIDHDKL